MSWEEILLRMKGKLMSSQKDTRQEKHNTMLDNPTWPQITTWNMSLKSKENLK